MLSCRPGPVRHLSSASLTPAFCCAAGGCRESVHLWGTWMHPRWTPACTGLPKPCASARSSSATALKKWRLRATMACFRGDLGCCTVCCNTHVLYKCHYAFHESATATAPMMSAGMFCKQACCVEAWWFVYEGHYIMQCAYWAWCCCQFHTADMPLVSRKVKHFWQTKL